MSGKISGETVRGQTQQTMLNLKAILNAAGASLDDVVKVTAYLSNCAGDWTEFDRSYCEWWSGSPPARTTVGAFLPGILVEIDAIAVVSDQP